MGKLKLETELERKKYTELESVKYTELECAYDSNVYQKTELHWSKLLNYCFTGEQIDQHHLRMLYQLINNNDVQTELLNILKDHYKNYLIHNIVDKPRVLERRLYDSVIQKLGINWSEEEKNHVRNYIQEIVKLLSLNNSSIKNEFQDDAISNLNKRKARLRAFLGITISIFAVSVIAAIFVMATGISLTLASAYIASNLIAGVIAFGVTYVVTVGIGYVFKKIYQKIKHKYSETIRERDRLINDKISSRFLPKENFFQLRDYTIDTFVFKIMPEFSSHFDRFFILRNIFNYNYDYNYCFVERIKKYRDKKIFSSLDLITHFIRNKFGKLYNQKEISFLRDSIEKEQNLIKQLQLLATEILLPILQGAASIDDAKYIISLFTKNGFDLNNNGDGTTVLYHAIHKQIKDDFLYALVDAGAVFNDVVTEESLVGDSASIKERFARIKEYINRKEATQKLLDSQGQQDDIGRQRAGEQQHGDNARGM